MRSSTVRGALIPVLPSGLRKATQTVLTRPVTVFKAPPGYGKSTLLRQFATEWRAAGTEVVGLNARIGHLETQIRRLFRAAQSSACTVLVLDDLHAVSDVTWPAALIAALPTMPSSLHVVLATRRPLESSLHSACQSVGVETLGSSLFRFNRDECLQVLRSMTSPQRSEAFSEDIYTLTGGWPAAVVAAARALASVAKGRRRSGPMYRVLSAGKSWERFLHDEVLRPQSPPVREFLRDSVVLGSVSAEICDAVLGRRDSREAIDELASQELLQPSAGNPGWFDHHPFLAETLPDVSRRGDGRLTHAIHRRAARWHAERHDRHRALFHYLALRDYDAAAELVLGAPPRLPVGTLSNLFAELGGAEDPASATIAKGVTGGFQTSGLSGREQQALAQLAAGLANKDIAAKLHVSMATVKAHIGKVFRKLSVHNRTAAVMEARRRGLIP